MAVQEIEANAVGTGDGALEAIVARCEPAVLRGLAADWPIVAAGRSVDGLAAYLARFDSGERAQAFIGDPGIDGRYYYADSADGFNFRRETLTFAQAFARIRQAAETAAETAYVGSLPCDSHFPGFAQENPVRFGGRAIEPRLWVGNRSTIACHYDAFENLAVVAAGRRRFTLYPPDAIGSLYVGPIDRTMAGQPVGMAVGSAIGDPRYPRFEAVRDRALVVELAPGDALFLPKLWWHQVEGLSPLNVLVNYWWDAFPQGPDAPFTAMMLALLTIAERPEKERAAWRAYFDHYVFRPDGHPLAHLPEDQHGILGKLAAGNGRRIRAMVMQLLRGN